MKILLPFSPQKEKTAIFQRLGIIIIAILYHFDPPPPPPSKKKDLDLALIMFNSI